MRESFFWHKVHSLTGIVPVGFYMLQHLTLNTFSLGGPAKFNGVIGFFAGIPFHVLLAMEMGAIWIPLAFHAIYGMAIIQRNSDNYSSAAYKYRENRYYRLQRWSGILALVFLICHVASTTVRAKSMGEEVIKYDAWHSLMTANMGINFFLYSIGIIACAYHLSYGIWNFSIRWGITISEKSQAAVGKFSAGMFVVVSLMGIAALYGFVNPIFEKKEAPVQTRGAVQYEAPVRL